MARKLVGWKPVLMTSTSAGYSVPVSSISPVRVTDYLGITVAGFPNFFILYGPNTNGAGSIIAQLERQAKFTARAVRRLESGRWRYVDTDPAAQHRYVTWLDQQLAAHASAMNSGCTNYYHDAGGANITQWPSSHLKYLLTVRALGSRGLRPAAARRHRGLRYA